MKSVCSVHEQAYDVGSRCPYCEVPEAPADANLWGIGPVASMWFSGNPVQVGTEFQSIMNAMNKAWAQQAQASQDIWAFQNPTWTRPPEKP